MSPTSTRSPSPRRRPAVDNAVRLTARFCLRGLGTRTEVLAVHALDLERAIDRFHRRIVPGFALSPEGSRNGASLVFPAVAWATPGDGDPARLRGLALVTGRVLRTAIGVMYQTGRRVTPAQGDVQCGQRQRLWPGLAHRPADPLARAPIEHPGPVQSALRSSSAGDPSGPDPGLGHNEFPSRCALARSCGPTVRARAA